MFRALLLLGVVFGCEHLFARHNYSEQGIITYKTLCKSCHGNPYKGAAMLRSHEWKKMFKGGDERIIFGHMKSPKAIKVFEGSYYKNRREDLIKFLISSASDKGVVPACDGNFCGD